MLWLVWDDKSAMFLCFFFFFNLCFVFFLYTWRCGKHASLVEEGPGRADGSGWWWETELLGQGWEGLGIVHVRDRRSARLTEQTEVYSWRTSRLMLLNRSLSEEGQSVPSCFINVWNELGTSSCCWCNRNLRRAVSYLQNKTLRFFFIFIYGLYSLWRQTVFVLTFSDRPPPRAVRVPPPPRPPLPPRAPPRPRPGRPRSPKLISSWDVMSLAGLRKWWSPDSSVVAC